VKTTVVHKLLGAATIAALVLCGFLVGYLIRGHSLDGRAKEDIRVPPVVGINTNGQLVAEINITEHAARTYGQLKYVTNTTHKGLLVTVIGEKSQGTCQALICLTEEGDKKFVTVIGLNPYKFLQYIMDSVMWPISQEIYKALEEPKTLFSESGDYRIRDAIFPIMFRRGGERDKEEWRKGMYFYQPIQQVSWIKFECIEDAKRLQQRGFIPMEISYFIGDNGVVIAHTATLGVFAD
jgi:hypothetical protein